MNCYRILGASHDAGSTENRGAESYATDVIRIGTGAAGNELSPMRNAEARVTLGVVAPAKATSNAPSTTDAAPWLAIESRCRASSWSPASSGLSSPSATAPTRQHSTTSTSSGNYATQLSHVVPVEPRPGTRLAVTGSRHSSMTGPLPVKETVAQAHQNKSLIGAREANAVSLLSGAVRNSCARRVLLRLAPSCQGLIDLGQPEGGAYCRQSRTGSP
jgi:hypothetical protein